MKNISVVGGLGLSLAQADVRDFHNAMGIPAPDFPSSLGPRHYLRARLIDEECKEFEEAAEKGDTLEMIDALCDIIYVALGSAVEMGVDLAPFWTEVQKANMAKAGGPVREDGKIMKPPGWKPPDHATVWGTAYGNTPIPHTTTD